MTVWIKHPDRNRPKFIHIEKHFEDLDKCVWTFAFHDDSVLTHAPVLLVNPHKPFHQPGLFQVSAAWSGLFVVEWPIGPTAISLWAWAQERVVFAAVHNKQIGPTSIDHLLLTVMFLGDRTFVVGSNVFGRSTICCQPTVMFLRDRLKRATFFTFGGCTGPKPLNGAGSACRYYFPSLLYNPKSVYFPAFSSTFLFTLTRYDHISLALHYYM